MVNEARASIAAALVFAASLLLVADSAPLWCVAVGLSCAAWRVLTASGRIARPRPRRGTRFLLGAITALLVVAVAASFRTLNGLAAGTALLVVMGALKVLEARSRRDDAIVVGVALFLLLAAALAGQALWRLPLYLLLICGACAAFALIAHPGGALTPRAALRLAARALAMSIPLAVACFLFFPRISGQFWTLQHGSAATTGLVGRNVAGQHRRARHRIRPGVSRALRGCAAAARRAVLARPGAERFRWLHLAARRVRWVYRAAPLDMLGEPLRYRITLEPTNQRWMFALDTVAASPRRDVFLSHDRQLTAPEPITSVISYDAVSHLQTRSIGPLSTLGRNYETRLPEDRNPRALALAHEMRARAGSDAEYARAVLDWFRDQRPRVHARARASPASTRWTPRCSTRSAASAATSPPRTPP